MPTTYQTRPAALSTPTRATLFLVGTFMVICSVAVSEIPVPGTSWPWMVVITGGLLLGLGAIALRWRPHAMPRPAWAALGAFTALLGWATVTALLSPHVMGDGTGAGFVDIPLSWVLPPLLQAFMVCGAAFLAVSLVPVRELFRALWWLSAGGALVTPLAWRLDASTWRVANPFGGAAVLHISLLLAAAIALAAARARLRTRLSIVIAIVHLASIAFGYTRGGLVCLGIFGLMLSVAVIRRRLRERNLPFGIIALGLGMLGIFALGVWNVLATRGADVTSDGRVETWMLAYDVWSSSPSTLLFGTGYGTMWPWHAIERGDFPQSAFLGLLDLAYGPSLGHAHNLYVALVTELGLLGAAMFAVVVLVLVLCLVGSTNRVQSTLAMGLVATLVGFAFDTFLLKNFPIAFVWWGCLFALVLFVRTPRGSHEQATGLRGPGTP